MSNKRRGAVTSTQAPLVAIFGQLGFVFDGERLYVRIIAPRSGANIRPRGYVQNSYRASRAIQKDINRALRSKPAQRPPVLPAERQEVKAKFGRARNARKLSDSAA